MLDDEDRVERSLAVGGMGAVYVGVAAEIPFDRSYETADIVRSFSTALPCD
jgi:hypothetical protein